MLDDFAKAIETSMHKQRDALKKHFPPAQYALTVGGMKAFIASEMKRQKKGAYDIGVWLVDMLKYKKKLTEIKGAIITAAVFDIIEAKAKDSRIIHS